MQWSDRQKSTGNRLELTWFAARNLWKKKHEGKVHYFKFPNTKEGYEAALHEWLQQKLQLTGLRKNFDVYEAHREIFEQVLTWYLQFGVPDLERKLYEQVQAFLDWLRVEVSRPELMNQLPVGAFCGTTLRNQFYCEFVNINFGYTAFGSRQYVLPDKWVDRIDRMKAGQNSKEPQTIGHWLTKYINRVSQRGGKFIKHESAKDREFKLKHFRGYCDQLAHITAINEDYLEKYHANLDSHVSGSTGNEISKDTKADYFAVFRMFVRWCSQQSTCELTPPANLESKEFGFREPIGTGRKRQEKKLKLWTSEEFKLAISTLPKPYPAFLLLMMNCGFRHVDLSELRKADLHLHAKRIVIQRNKLNQQDTAPVISYLLWDRTVELLREAMSDDPVYVFRNLDGGPVENSIKVWWKRNSERYGLLGKRLDYIRKTGATMIARIDSSLDDMYLGETLSTTAKVHYSFHDGEPCQGLDDAILSLGAEFGLAEAPSMRVTLTKDVLEQLKRAGIDLAKLR